MATGFNILCYKSKTLADGAHPLMLRITKDRKRKYSSIGISLNPVYWDFQKNKPKRNLSSAALAAFLLTLDIDLTRPGKNVSIMNR